jgi:hypothetical protein
MVSGLLGGMVGSFVSFQFYAPVLVRAEPWLAAWGTWGLVMISLRGLTARLKLRPIIALVSVSTIVGGLCILLPAFVVLAGTILDLIDGGFSRNLTLFGAVAPYGLVFGTICLVVVWSAARESATQRGMLSPLWVLGLAAFGAGMAQIVGFQVLPGRDGEALLAAIIGGGLAGVGFAVPTGLLFARYGVSWW